MSDLSGSLSGGQAISGSLSGGSTLQGGLSMGGVSPAALLDKADVITDSASGNIVSISDGMASPVLGLSVDIEPIQDLHGYSNPWPAGGGVNKYNVEANPIEQGSIASADGQDAQSETRIRTSGYISVKAETAYIISCAESSIFYYAHYYASDNSYIGNSNGWRAMRTSATTPQNTAYLRLVLSLNNGSQSNINPSDVTKLQIEEGSIVHAWQPYSNLCPISGRSEVKVYVEETYDAQATPKATIQLGQTVYGGTVDVTSGKLSINRAIKTANTIVAVSSSTGYGMVTIDAENIIDATIPQISNILQAWTSAVATMPAGYFRCLYSGTYGRSHIAFNLGISSGSSSAQKTAYQAQLDEWANAGTPLQVVYGISTPIEIDLTPEEIQILQLDNNIWSDTGNTEVTYRADTKQYILKKIAEALNA